MTGIGCCARAAMGHPATAPPRSVMNLRRCMLPPSRQARMVKVQARALEGVACAFLQPPRGIRSSIQRCGPRVLAFGALDVHQGVLAVVRKFGEEARNSDGTEVDRRRVR